MQWYHKTVRRRCAYQGVAWPGLGMRMTSGRNCRRVGQFNSRGQGMLLCSVTESTKWSIAIMICHMHHTEEKLLRPRTLQ